MPDWDALTLPDTSVPRVGRALWPWPAAELSPLVDNTGDGLLVLASSDCAETEADRP
jgi:hypothetical protein